MAMRTYLVETKRGKSFLHRLDSAITGLVLARQCFPLLSIIYCVFLSYGSLPLPCLGGSMFGKHLMPYFLTMLLLTFTAFETSENLPRKQPPLRSFAPIYVLPILSVCQIAEIKKTSVMIILVHKSCVATIVFPLDTSSLPLEISKFRRGNFVSKVTWCRAQLHGLRVRQRTKRSTYQAGYCQGNSLVPFPPFT